MMRSEPFSDNFEQARSRFLNAARAQGLKIDSFINPHTGPRGEELACDVATYNMDNARGVVLIESGVHGIEGFAGSACQTSLLNDNFVENLPEDIGVVMVHALNPHGFAWERRVNEDNIDLNRNFIDFNASLPTSPVYDQLKEQINPDRVDLAYWNKTSGTLLSYAKDHGVPALQAAITAGQYKHADGICYGGADKSWSRKTFEKIFDTYLKDAEHVAFIDIHTGLGRKGVGQMITEVPETDQTFVRAKDWWGDLTTSTVAGTSNSVALSGTVDSFLLEKLGPDRVTMGTLEYGTVPMLQVLEALRKDNWLHMFAQADAQEAPGIKTQIRAAFYPDDRQWEKDILSVARTVARQTVHGLSKHLGEAPSMRRQAGPVPN